MQKKITESTVSNLYGGVYILYFNNSITIGNGYTEVGYYSSSMAGIEVNSINEFKEWIADWVNNTNEDEQLDINQFKNAKRKRCKFREGDYFRVKLDRNLYGYGRILMDIYKRNKNGIKYWNILMGRPLIIELFHIVTNDKNISINELKKLKTFPSQHIMDNVFFYGEFEIIGNDKLLEKLAFPIMYGIHQNEERVNTITFQCGEINKSVPYSKEALIKKKHFPEGYVQYELDSYKNNGIGTFIDNNVKVMKRCIQENSNNYYWEYFKYISHFDLRSPINREELIEVLKQFNLLDLLEIYKNN